MGEGVVRSRSGLGMVLHGEQRKLAVADSLDGSVIEIEVGDLQVRSPQEPALRRQLLRTHGFGW